MGSAKIIEGRLVIDDTLEILAPFPIHTRGRGMYGKQAENKRPRVCRIGDEDFTRVEQAADILGIDKSNFMRQVVLHAASAVLLLHRQTLEKEAKDLAIQQLAPRVETTSPLSTKIAPPVPIDVDKYNPYK